MQADAGGCRRMQGRQEVEEQEARRGVRKLRLVRVQGQCRNTPKSQLKSLSFGGLDLDSRPSFFEQQRSLTDFQFTNALFWWWCIPDLELKKTRQLPAKNRTIEGSAAEKQILQRERCCPPHASCLP
jgi:hypothetical protein